MRSLPAAQATGHTVYFGRAGGALRRLAELDGGSANIARPALLQAHLAYAWRVDTRTAAAGVVPGATWTLATGAEKACEITPRPPQPPDPPGPAACAAAEGKYCPGLGGTGAQVGSACYACVVANSKVLEDAGCWTNSGSGGRHTFVEAFCGTATLTTHTA